MEPRKEKRTNQQNRAMHKYFALLADALNNAGYDMKKTLKPEVDIAWTPAMVKEYLWRPIQIVMIGKQSTTEMETVDPSKIYEVLNRHIAEKFGISIEWPSYEEWGKI